MKIALVSPYDFAYPGGVTNHISSLEHYLTLMGNEVKVIAPASKAVTTFGERFISIGRPRPVPASGSICRVTISPRLASYVKPVLERERFDIIHLHEPLMPTLCTTVLRMSQAVNVGTFHAHAGTPGYNFGKPISTIFLRRWFRKLNFRIAVSKPAMEFANKHMPGQYVVVPNGIELQRFNPNVKPIDEFCDGKVNLLFVGRLEKRKGLNYLINAYWQAKKEIPESRLIVVGPGTMLRRKYERHIARHGIKDITFVGYVGHDDLPRYYKTADIYCTPATRGESFGIVLLEAMAVGKPVIASNIPGYASVMQHGSEGLLVPPRDVRSLTQALVSLMADEPLRRKMGAQGMAKSADYSWSQIAQRIYDIYVKLLNRGDSPDEPENQEGGSLSEEVRHAVNL